MFTAQADCESTEYIHSQLLSLYTEQGVGNTFDTLYALDLNECFTYTFPCNLQQEISRYFIKYVQFDICFSTFSMDYRDSSSC